MFLIKVVVSLLLLQIYMEAVKIILLEVVNKLKKHFLIRLTDITGLKQHACQSLHVFIVTLFRTIQISTFLLEIKKKKNRKLNQTRRYMFNNYADNLDYLLFILLLLVNMKTFQNIWNNQDQMLRIIQQYQQLLNGEKIKWLNTNRFLGKVLKNQIIH